MGARHPRLRARQDPRLRRHRRVRDPEAELARRRLRRRHLDRQCARALLRARHHGDRGAPDGQARQALGRQAGVAGAGHHRQYRARRGEAGAGGGRRAPGRVPAQAPGPGGQDRARPAAAADAAGVRARADGGDRHRRRPGAWPARRLLMSGGGVLDEILSHKRSELAGRRSHVSVEDLQARCRRLTPALDFEAALRPRAGERVRLIAEVKKASPSAGVLNAALDPATQARAYAGAGAAAISVLTDEKYFRGSLDDLVAVRASVSAPLLRKEFIVDEYQLWEARAAGADAVLLIVAALEDAALRDLLHAAKGAGLATLVEVHTAGELDRALRLGAPVIGVNNRDLQTLTTSLDPSLRLLPQIPPGPLAVSESGLASGADVARVVAAGAHAVLVGETLLRAGDVAAKVRELSLR